MDRWETKIDLFQKMIEEIEDYAIIVMDADGIIKNWNRGAEKIKGYREEEIIGKHFSIFYLQEDIDRNLPEILITRARKTGRSSQEGWRKKKDGSRFWGSITITAIHDDENNVIGFSKLTRDLTEKKEAEDRLRLSEERYHKMIAEIQDYAIVLLDENGIVQNWNAGAEKIKGYPANEIVGKSFERFYPAEDQKNGLPARLLGTAKAEGRAVHKGWRVRKDGTRFWGLIVITALHADDGSVIGFSKVTRDLTQQKTATDKLNMYARELELQNKELEQFAYIASHDLQEPIRKIRTFADLIQNNIHDEEFVKKYFAKLDTSTKRMSELIRSLLAYSRISRDLSGKPGEYGDVDLNAILSEVREDFELLIEEKKATITSEKLPVIKGNRVQLIQLFSNLISNSLKFTEKNPLIRIGAVVVDGKQAEEIPQSLRHKFFHKLTFRDNGIGFDQKYDSVIFTLFQRLHSKEDYAGTGIGLAICKKIVENHGGAITAISSPGGGATFNIYFPV